MKQIKKTMVLILALVSMAISVMSITACKPEQDISERLTKEQQVQIAKDTFVGIANASKEQSTVNIARDIRVSAYGVSDLERLLDKYNSSGMLAYPYTTYFVIAQPAESLIDKVGSEALIASYATEHNFINITSEYYGRIEKLLPASINFHGVKKENGYNKIYTTSKMQIRDTNENDCYYTLTSYYNSVSDYGYDLVSYAVDCDGTPMLIAYYSINMATSTFFYVICPVYAEFFMIYYNGKYIQTVLTAEENASISDMVKNAYNVFIENSSTVEKNNNNGVLKENSNLSKITLDFDVSKCSDLLL